MFILFLLTFLSAEATKLVPLKISEHIKSSDGLVIGRVTDLKVKKFSENQVVSKVVIDPEIWTFAKRSSKSGLITINFPGGDGVISPRLENAPRFKIGENVAILIEDIAGTPWVSKMALGKFSAKKMGKDEIFINQIHSKRPFVGQIRKSDFLKISERNFGKLKLKLPSKNQIKKIVESKKNNQYRKVASFTNANVREQGRIGLFFVCGLLLLILFYFRRT
jgi:hypothetical protein